MMNKASHNNYSENPFITYYYFIKTLKHPFMHDFCTSKYFAMQKIMMH